MITVHTKLIALLGNPLGQSFSNRMQNAAFEAMGLDYCYFPLETTGESLPAIMAAARHMNFAGLGVTKPDKLAIMQYLDEIDPLAKNIGAVNTVVIREGRFIGCNTDGEGGVRSIEQELERPLPEVAFFCFGAGGAARALCYTLADRGVRSIAITDVCDEAADVLARELNAHFGPVAKNIPHTARGEVRAAFRASGAVMNCSGLGMRPHLAETPIDAEAFLPGQLAFDATYNPAQTQFLRDAARAGAKTLNGLGMLVHQGALQFKLWTGLEEPTAIMFAQARLALEESARR